MNKKKQLEDLLQALRYDEFEAAEELVTPGHKRTLVQEFLLELFEPGILNDPDFEFVRDNNEKIYEITKQLGVCSNFEVVVGRVGYDASITHLIDLALLVTHKDTSTLQRSFQYMQHIAANTSKVFSQTLKIFPPTFPPKYEQTTSTNIEKELKSALENWESECRSLKSRVSMLDIKGEYKPPSQKQLDKLQQEIQDFSQTVKQMRETYEHYFQSQLSERYYGVKLHEVEAVHARYVQNLSGIGKKAQECLDLHKRFKGLLNNIESLWSCLKTIETSVEC